MASITFNYDPANPDDVSVEVDLDEKDDLDSTKLTEILATGVDAVVVTCWDTDRDREEVALRVAKMLLLANDARRSDDDE